MRWDSTTGQYDMGFRNYDPGINQFASRDMYDGALADAGLSTDPFTGSRYAFGNPISNIESDGHTFLLPTGGGTTSSGTSSAMTTMPSCPLVLLACSGTSSSSNITSSRSSSSSSTSS